MQATHVPPAASVRAESFGIPYARNVFVAGVHHRQCPACGVLVREDERKDFESDTGAGYAAHYAETHQ